MPDDAGARDAKRDLPKVDQRDLDAIRSYLPGKLLGRLSALLAVLILVIGNAGAFGVAMGQVFGFTLPEEPWLKGLILVGLPAVVIIAQIISEWRAARVADRLKRLAIAPAAVPAGYFRIGPYDNTPEDRAAFRRADNAQGKVLAWLRRREGAPLYLTGQSGCGKSSLLQAAVLPALQENGWTVAEARAWQDPMTALREALRDKPGVPRARDGEQPSLRAMIEGAARRATGGLLILLDQFEEFVILQDEAQRRDFAALLADLHARPVAKLRLLLAFRSDYRPAMEDLDLPPLHEGENWQEIGAFTQRAAAEFLDQAQLGLQPEAMEALLHSAAALDDLAGLVRPVTLNVVGHVLAEGGARAPTLDATVLVRRYVAQVVGAPELRHPAPLVLEHLLTAQATKRPREEAELLQLTGLRRGEVRAVLTALARAGLARVLDPARGLWELSHDFVARVVARHLGQGRQDGLRRALTYAAPAMLVLLLATGAGAMAWERAAEDRAIRALAGLGISVSPMEGGSGGVRIERTSVLNQTNLAAASQHLARIGPRVKAAVLADAAVNDLTPLSGLTALQSLDLQRTRVTELAPLSGLTALQSLDLGGTGVTELAPLSGLKALQSLDLGGTRVTELAPLSGLKALQRLYLGGTRVTELAPLSGLKALQRLYLGGTGVTELAPLSGLTALQRLYLGGTGVTELAPLSGLTALQSVDLGGTPVTELAPLSGLTALQSLDLQRTGVTELAPLSGLKALQSLDLGGTRVTELAPLSGLKALQSLDLGGTGVTELAPLSGLKALQSLDLGGTRVTELAPLSGLKALQRLYLGGTRVTELAPLSGLKALQRLYLGGTGVTELAPLSGLTALQRLYLGGTGVTELAPLSGLTALQSVDLGGTPVTELAPLSGLTALQSVDLGGTPVTELAPLSGLTALQSLDLQRTGVTELAPLSGLTALQSLDLLGTGVTELAPLSGLTALWRLSLGGTGVTAETRRAFDAARAARGLPRLFSQ